MNKVFIWCYMALAFSPVLFAQVDFKATVSKNTLGINERLRVEFSMNKDGDNFAPLLLTDFEWLLGQASRLATCMLTGNDRSQKVIRIC